MMELKKDLVQLLRKGIIENEEDAKLFKLMIGEI